MSINKEYPINRLTILSNVSAEIQRNGDKRFRAITSGSYTNGGITPVIPIMLSGVLKNTGDSKTFDRGGVAVLKDGRIIVGRMVFDKDDGNTAAERVTNSIQSSFSASNKLVLGVEFINSVVVSPVIPTAQALRKVNEKISEVRDFMGGGALVIENGKSCSDTDMSDNQKFDGGYRSDQLNGSRMRVAIGQIPSGKTYLLITDTEPKAAANTLKSRYRNLVFFDGGNGFWAHATNPDYSSPPTDVGANSTGFGVN